MRATNHSPAVRVSRNADARNQKGAGCSATLRISTPFMYEATGKDYAAEATGLHELIQARRPGAASLLDVACGTWAHLTHLLV